MHHFLAWLLALTISLTGASHFAFGPHTTSTPPLPVDTSGAPVRIPIFIYHTITNEKVTASSYGSFSNTPELLDEHLTYLEEHGYTTVTMKEVADMLRRGTTSPVAKPVALTFDDGWVTQYKNALPILQKHHVKATFYIFPNPVSKDDRFMTWEQLAELRDKGYEIASHSYTHPLLSKQTPEMLHHEFADSKKLLEEKLNITVTDFASPFGYTSPAVVAELKADGYETGRTTNQGFTHATGTEYALDAYLVHQGIKDFTWALEYGK